MLTRCTLAHVSSCARGIALAPNFLSSPGPSNPPSKREGEKERPKPRDSQPESSRDPWKSVLEDFSQSLPLWSGTSHRRLSKQSNFFSSHRISKRPGRGFATDASQAADEGPSTAPPEASTSQQPVTVPESTAADTSLASDAQITRHQHPDSVPEAFVKVASSHTSDDDALTAPTGASTSQPPDEKPESLFNSSDSAWEHVFKGLDELPPLMPATTRNPLRPSSQTTTPANIRSRRQSMTAREISAFDDMFNMIFNAVSEKKFKTTKPDPLSSAGIGRGPEGSSPMSDLFGKLRRHSKKYKWTVEEDEVLDKKKAQMELCETDQQLLAWALREVFADSQAHEAAARRAIEAAAAGGRELDALPMLQPPAYPHLVAALVRAFREKHRDPHLALAVFAHARHLSIASYVFGCTTPAYNELIETRWTCFRDLRGVCDALEEMRVNGIEPDNRTKRLVEALRREVGERNLWQEENDIDTGEVWQMLAKIESLILPKSRLRKKNVQFSGVRPRSTRWTAASEEWKQSGATGENNPDDNWEFGQWDIRPKRRRLRPTVITPASSTIRDADLEFR